MKTFIFLTFGFLGFALYEMSGGADFRPASERVAAAAPEPMAVAAQVANAPVPRAPPPAPARTATVTRIDATPDVPPAATGLASVKEVTADAEPSAPPKVTYTEAKVFESNEAPRIILPSLIATNRSLSSVSILTGGDIRIVSAIRVNVRDGPSTNYGVVAKLAQGDEVEILEDNGDGWVLVQALDGYERGWMADFLLTSD